MKKLILILSAIVLLVACSKKQDAKPSLTAQNATASDFAGNWVLTVDTVSTTTNGQTIITTDSNGDGAHFQYNNNGTGFIGATGTANANFTYTVSQGMLYIHIPASSSNVAQDLTFTLISITAKKMILRAYNANVTEDLVFEKS